MPQLNENKYPQADLIADINAGTSFVKVKPERIGDLIYFDSTLPQAEPQDAAVVARKRKKTLLYGLGALIVIWAFFLLVFPEALFWPFILSCVVLIVALVILFRTVFTGFDYFVGTEGFAEYIFKKNRENVEKKEFRFDEGAILKFDSGAIYENRDVFKTRKASTWRMCFLGQPEHNDVAHQLYELVAAGWVGVQKDGHSGNAHADFMYQVDKMFTSIFLDKSRAAIEAGEEIPFYPVTREQAGSKTWILHSPVWLSKDAIRYVGDVYSGDNLKKISIQEGELWFKSLDPSAGLLQKMKQIKRVPLEFMGNQTAFETLLQELYGIKK